MATAAVLLADGFEEIEAVTVIDVLRRAGVEVAAVGVTGRQPQGAHGIRVQADTTLDEAAGRTWDAVVLPGGMPGAERLASDARVQALLRAQHERGGIVAAICAAPMALGRAGLLHGRLATCYPGFEGHLEGAVLREDRVVRDANLVTSRGPGTALDFALTLVGILVGGERAAELRRGMLAG